MNDIICGIKRRPNPIGKQACWSNPLHFWINASLFDRYDAYMIGSTDPEPLCDQRRTMATQDTDELLRDLHMLLPATPEAQAVFERVRDELAPDHLLTTREAADFLGIRSVNTLKALVRTAHIPTVKVGTHMRIARRDLERLQRDRRTQALQESDEMWDTVDDAFGAEGMAQEEMEALSATRPGSVPWPAT
jgi:excisionase family DNA binding protein